MPNPNRPRLNTEAEKKFAEVDQRAAAQYSSMETLTAQFNQLADQMQADDDCVPEATDPFDDDSLVTNISDARIKLLKP